MSHQLSDLPPRIQAKIEVTQGCWTWTACRNKEGYGRLRPFNGSRYAHRAVYIALVGPIPEGLELDHLCVNPACCNPDHLEPVTRQENIRRSDVGKVNRGKTHCPQAHPYSGDNLYAAPRGDRICRACQRMSDARYRARRKKK